MYSATAVTYETYDLNRAVAELTDQIQAALPDCANKCGILFMDPDYDGEELTARLQHSLGCEIIGTTSAVMLSSAGYHANCATLLMLGGDDCVFATALTPALDESNAEEALRAAYSRALAKLKGKDPVMAFVLSARDDACSENARLKLLADITGGLPVFGGVAADRFEFAHTRVFGEGGSGERSLALLLLAGNLRPRFVMRNVQRKHLSKSRITASEGSVVQSIDGESAYAYMMRNGADDSSAMALHFTPLLVETRDGDNDDGHIICRPFISLDPDTGCGTTISEVPVGSAVTVQHVDGSDIGEASRAAMQALLREIESDDSGYVYTTVITMSCAARHMLLAFDREREALLAREIFPANLAMGGFYSFGEFCPIAVVDGKADNRLHNLSLGLCAL